MNQLKLIGYWKGDGEARVWPHPKELVDPDWEPERRHHVVRYLRTGIRVHEDLGFAHCRFQDGPPPKEMGNAELTDGVWIWPEGLWVYVERYSVKLPDLFVAHMALNDFQLTPDLDAEELDSREIDTAFWAAWCKGNRWPLRRRLLRW